MLMVGLPGDGNGHATGLGIAPPTTATWSFSGSQDQGVPEAFSSFITANKVGDESTMTELLLPVFDCCSAEFRLRTRLNLPLAERAKTPPVPLPGPFAELITHIATSASPLRRLLWLRCP